MKKLLNCETINNLASLHSCQTLSNSLNILTNYTLKAQSRVVGINYLILKSLMFDSLAYKNIK